LRVDRGERQSGVDARLAAEQPRVERRELRSKPIAQQVEIAPLQREAARVVVSAEVREEIGHRFELLVEVDGGDAPRRAGAAIAVDADDERRAVVLLCDSPGGEADDAFVPVLAGKDENASDE